MPAKIIEVNRCRQCGEEHEAGLTVCRHCHAILLTHASKRRTPGWVIALLIVVIVVLLCLIAYVAYRIFVLRAY